MTHEFPHEAEPDGNVYLPHHWWVGIALMIVGFQQWQPDHSTTGALVAALGLAIALDDYLSHAFGWWTPLDAAFKRAMQNDRFRSAYLGALDVARRLLAKRY